MKPDPKKLDRWLRKVGKREAVSQQNVVTNWSDEAAIRILIRNNLWDAVEAWASDKPEVREKLMPLQGAFTRAVAIGSRIEEKSEWPQLQKELLEDERLFAAAVELLESAATTQAATFITTLLVENPSDAQKQMMRKALYRLKERGIAAQTATASIGIAPNFREFFVFGENRLSRWHPMFYYRPETAFLERGDLFILQLEEGRQFGIAEQRRNVEINPDGLRQLAERYSQSLEQQSGMRIDFHLLAPEHARYFLQKSGELLRGSPGERGITDFFKFIGSGEVKDPLEPFSNYNGYVPDLQQASSVLEVPYFAHWVFTTSELTGFIEETQKLEQGPIVLPPAKLREMQHAAATKWVNEYFNERNRRIWALAFGKAAFFLKDLDFYNAQCAWKLSTALQDPEVPSDTIPAIGYLLEKSTNLILQEKKKEQEKERATSLIVTPAEFAAQQQQRKK